MNSRRLAVLSAELDRLRSECFNTSDKGIPEGQLGNTLVFSRTFDTRELSAERALIAFIQHLYRAVQDYHAPRIAELETLIRQEVQSANAGNSQTVTDSPEERQKHE